MAQIIQANDAPFKKIDIDPVTLDIIENALRNARVEMDGTSGDAERFIRI